MEGAGQVLTFEQILQLNHLQITEHGGTYFQACNNLQNPAALEHMLHLLDGELFGEPAYKNVFEKAAALASAIINGHVFYDGNKRTGMAAAVILLRLRGKRLILTPQEAVDAALAVAMKEMNRGRLATWFADHCATEATYQVVKRPPEAGETDRDR